MCGVQCFRLFTLVVFTMIVFIVMSGVYYDGWC